MWSVLVQRYREDPEEFFTYSSDISLRARDGKELSETDGQKSILDFIFNQMTKYIDVEDDPEFAVLFDINRYAFYQLPRRILTDVFFDQGELVYKEFARIINEFDDTEGKLDEAFQNYYFSLVASKKGEIRRQVAIWVERLKKAAYSNVGTLPQAA